MVADFGLGILRIGGDQYLEPEYIVVILNARVKGDKIYIFALVILIYELALHSEIIAREYIIFRNWPLMLLLFIKQVRYLCYFQVSLMLLLFVPRRCV
jgi:hypothetical protein